ncbi:unnamed protein product, partial [Menidia menidia]
VFAVVVFSCITTEGYINPPDSAEARCIFNQNASACRYAVGVGVLGFLLCSAFLLADAYAPFMSSAPERRHLWGRTQDVRAIPQDAARAAIAFSFFSIATWGILTYFALGRFRRGVADVA